uniref:Choline transporter-like protein n=1 Tax=Macrostomum lignano TaxID=282301 RepID=A0A1I8HS82_9PLAT
LLLLLLFATMGLACGGCSSERAQLDREAGNPNESRNPLDRRRRRQTACADWPWCLVFGAFLCGLLVIAGFAFSMGDLQRIFSPFDCYGNTCGSDRNIRVPGVPLSGRDTRAEPYLFHFSDLFATNTLSVCVSQCPNRPIDSLEELKQVFLRDKINYCSYDFPLLSANATHQNKFTGPCPDTPISRMEPVYGRCITAGIRSNILPNDTVNRWKLNNIYGYLNLTPIFSLLLSDLYSVWSLLIYIFVLSGLLSGSLVAGVRIFPRLAGHAMLVSCACLCSSATALLWWVFADQKSQLDAKEAVNFPLLDLETQNEDAFLVLSIVSTVLLLVLLFCLCVVCSRARYVGPLFVQAAKCVGSVPQLCALPIVTCLQPVRSLAVDSGLHFYVRSASQRAENDSSSITMNNSLIREPIEPCLAMDRPSWVSWLWIYHVAGLLWVGEFALACQQYVLGRVACGWYYRDERHSAKWPVAGALADLVWRRLGTVAIGSLVIAVTRLPRWALSWFHKRLRNQKACGGSDACCVRCRRLNKSALAAAALTGEPFWSAAGAASDLLGNKHASLRLAALNSAGDFVLLTAKLAVSAACTIVCTVLLMLKWSDKSIRFFPLPIVLVATFAFLVAHCFLSVFEFVIDAIFICFSYDLGTNDGSPGREQFMTDDLKNLVFDTCDAMTSNLPPGSIGNSSSRRQAAAATMRLTSSGVQQENGAKTAAVDDEAAAHLRLSELEDLDQMEDVPDIALQPQGRPDSSLPMRRMQAPTASQEADDDLRSLRTPASTPIRSTGGPADQGSGDNAQPKTV